MALFAFFNGHAVWLKNEWALIVYVPTANFIADILTLGWLVSDPLPLYLIMWHQRCLQLQSFIFYLIKDSANVGNLHIFGVKVRLKDFLLENVKLYL